MRLLHQSTIIFRVIPRNVSVCRWQYNLTCQKMYVCWNAKVNAHQASTKIANFLLEFDDTWSRCIFSYVFVHAEGKKSRETANYIQLIDSLTDSNWSNSLKLKIENWKFSFSLRKYELTSVTQILSLSREREYSGSPSVTWLSAYDIEYIQSILITQW